MRTSLAGLLVALLTLSTPSFANEPAPLSAYGDLPGGEDMAISHNGNRIAAISRIKQERQPLVTENGSLISATPIGDMKVRGLDWAGDEIIVLTRGNGESGTYYTIDMAKLRADAIGYERPSIHLDQIGPISTVEYKADDGLELDGILTLPPGREPKNLPVVMLPHGGLSAHDIETFDWWAQAFASRGYAVFQPNFRGSTNHDLTFRAAGDGQWGRKMQTDISDGLAELVKRGIADPNRACIMGGSYGGFVALAGVTLQKGLYRCAAAVAPVSDLEDMYRLNFV